jgi:hypothetical protein
MSSTMMMMMALASGAFLGLSCGLAPGPLLALLLAMMAAPLGAAETRMVVYPQRPSHRISRYLTGACLEDVNHEVYGGLYSQMLFGESFQEPAPTQPPQGFRAFGGEWQAQGGELRGGAGPGPKLVADAPAFSDGAASVEVLLPDRHPGNAGLILRVASPGPGPDSFAGYEVSLDAAAQLVRLGRHRHNWELIRDTPCAVPTNQWITLTVRLAGPTIEVLVNGQRTVTHQDGAAALPSGQIGLRQWNREARYRNLAVATGGQTRRLEFAPSPEPGGEVSGMWHLVRCGDVEGVAVLERQRPFTGAQSQRLRYVRGEGEFGIENQGLNRWGLHFVGGKLYEGVLWVRVEQPTELWVALESADGARLHASKCLKAQPDSRRPATPLTGAAPLAAAPVPAASGEPDGWQRIAFTLRPRATEERGRLVLTLRRPGSITLGYALLQPGPWGRFKGLPVRRDVAEAMIDQGLTALRYGGSMVNHPDYRWKQMLGPRERRPPYRGTWYPYSSNGWGILDFLDFCEAAGFLAIPAFNLDETPGDLADFVKYANGQPDSEWGRRRAAAGHRKPYQLRHLELGNEERVDMDYAAKFQALAEATWAADPRIILVVGDFAYTQPIAWPCSSSTRAIMPKGGRWPTPWSSMPSNAMAACPWPRPPTRCNPTARTTTAGTRVCSS